ncbi:helicase-related protein [Rosenbergiella collisarenosi]|uniref:helicase-related protein n=1 Tax=Rosenbergiella collisarenosi TaxID=1544695 RepID=UPI001F4DC392|nr:helicase-related protein [Rosenbergiella collisarenosi]
MSVKDILAKASSIDAVISLVEGAYRPRSVVPYGVTKVEGVSLQKTRRNANDAAVELLNSLPEGTDGNTLTEEQRAVLAKYTGEGGLQGEGGSQYEYYTPQFMAEGIWELMDEYGASAGHVLEPSAGTGIFQETKPRSAIMSSAEISPISGRINKLLHPEDDVNLGAFEKLASAVPDGNYDHAVGNVPFGEGRSGFAQLDPAYAQEKNIGNYFVLRTIDKVKPGGLVVLVVPNGMTDSSKSKKLRDLVSRKAEFLGAHRMPSGTFAESGTSTVVDVWILRKHTEALKAIIDDSTDKVLKQANVLWTEFLTGKWFLQDGKKFVHGEMERTDYQNMLVVKKDAQITDAAMKAALSRRFDSRIDYDALSAPTSTFQGAKEGDKRLVGGIWHEFNGEAWVKQVNSDDTVVDATQFGASTYAELSGRTSSTQGLLSYNVNQLRNIATSYPNLLNEQTHAVIQFAAKQSPANQDRILRGGLIGLEIIKGTDRAALGQDSAEIFADAAKLVTAEYDQYGRCDTIKAKNLSDPQSRAWLAFQGNISATGEISELLSGTLDKEAAVGVNFAEPEQVLAHLFSQVSLTPVTLDEFRANFTGELPADDDAALTYLAQFKEIALDGNGNLVPMTRASSGNIRGRAKELLALANSVPEGHQQDNYLRQIDEINAKRGRIELKKIKINLNARWLDRRLIQEFLADQGYDQFKYTTPDLDIQNGELLSPDGYAGKDGVFTGYQMRTVVSPKTGEKEFKKANNADGFLNQLENYLNGVKPRGTNAGKYLTKIAAMEESFNEWIASHAIAEQVEDDYNDAFNGYIPFSHSDASLNLSGISGKRVPMSHQNEEVRRLSEDGRGIMGFGTGLGKTTTGLALEAYNFENGRTKRTATVVPKAVYQNWYHEAREFYSDEAFSDMLFVGLDVVMGEDGKPLTAPVRNEKNEIVYDKDGNPVVRDVVKESSAADILLRLNQIPTSSWRNVILTKEQFASIPLRQETIEANQQQAVFDAIESGRVDIGKSSHREASKINRLKDKAADTGSAKKQNVPYFEDMNFDSVIADEGHNYRNSFSAGREAGQLAYLPTSAVSQISRDMAVKSSYLMNKNNGRGVVMLTATPLVNSPIDAFNMLSHVIPAGEWQAMGVYTPDDFVRVFGETATVDVQAISGAIEQKQGLVGFKNLDGLRGIFHRWASIKTAADVKATVKIPDIIENSVAVPMTDEQTEAYEVLRQRATMLSNGVALVKMEDGETGISTSKPDDAIFSIIRDMDKVSLDPDLYKNLMRFQFKPEDAEKVKEIVAKLPLSAGGSDNEDEDDTSSDNPLKQSKEITTTLSDNGTYLELTVSVELEKEALKAIADAGIDLSTVSHPVPPKYAALIENLRAGLEDGKQIIFIDEKTQHGKLQRIISQALGMDASQIGIINATTVASAGGPKIKAVKPPVEPKEGKDGYKDGAWEKYYADKARYEDYIAAKNDVSLSGMEGIAADYNEGRTPIVICNKKAEVGINLHKGTTDIHHLTFPWTPASINQRNGRGARVGSTNESVRAHYYCGKGTFDDFRLETLQRKKDWLTTVMTSDESEMANGDAASHEERAVMLAANPEERRAMLAKQKAEREAEQKRVATQNATNALNTYLKASNAASRPIEQLQSEVDAAEKAVSAASTELEHRRERQNYYEEAVKDKGSSLSSYYQTERRGARRNFKAANEEFLAAQDTLKKANNALKRAKTAGSAIKRSLADVQRAVKDGVLNIDQDVIDNPASYTQLPDARLAKVGNYFKTSASEDGDITALVRLTAIYPEKGSCSVEVINIEKSNHYSYSRWEPSDKRNVSMSSLGEKITISESDAKLLKVAATGVRSSEISNTFTASKFMELTKAAGIKINVIQNSYSSSSGVDYWLVDKGGKLDRESMVRNTLAGDNLVYPDSSNEQLKARVAVWYQDANNSGYGLTEFLKALYGSNYSTVLQGYGEQATIKDVEPVYDQFIAKCEQSYPQYGSFFHTDLAQGKDYYFMGAEAISRWKYSISERGARAALTVKFSNESQITDFIRTVGEARIKAKTDAMVQASTEYAQAVVKATQAVSASQIQSSLAEMMDVRYYDLINSTKNDRDVIRSDVPLYIATGVFLGIVLPSEVDEAVTWSAITQRISSTSVGINALRAGKYTTSGRVEGEADMSFEQWVNALAGTMTDAEREAIKTKAVKAADFADHTVENKVEATQAQGYAIHVINNDLNATVKSKFRGRFYTRTLSIKAGNGLVLVDTGSEPVLKQKEVRELLKTRYGAIFWDFSQNPVAGCEITSPAWVIEKQVDQGELTAQVTRVSN